MLSMRFSALKVAVTLFVALAMFGSANGQSKKTIILVRHAEKDVSEAADKNDPVLTVEGKKRAERLAEIVKKYKPGAIYSTDFKRTLETAAAIAAKRKLQVQLYDPKKSNELIDAMMKSKTKRFLVVGHSNTIPGLANMLGKKEVFSNLDDLEYGVIWIVRIKDGQVKKTEVIPY